jgi:hypothetical protein
MKRAVLIALASATLGLAFVAAPAQAAITVCTSGTSCVSGTTTVNLGAFTNAPVVTGTVGIGGPLVTFTSTQGNLSTNPGAATVFTASGAALTNLTFEILTGFSAAEFNLENGTASSFVISLTDSAGDIFNQTVSKLQGSNIFDIIALAGTTYTSATLVSTGDGGFADFKQLRVVPAITSAVPEPGTWALMLLGFGGMGFSMRRRRRVAGLMQIA